jgi:hypothetical protein
VDPVERLTANNTIPVQTTPPGVLPCLLPRSLPCLLPRSMLMVSMPYTLSSTAGDVRILSSDVNKNAAAPCVCPADMSDIMKQDMERFAARQQAAAAASSNSISSSGGTSRQVRHLDSACTAQQRVSLQRTCTAGITPVAGMGCGCGACVARHVWHVLLPVCQHI